jgi:hypothetical protein
MRLIGRPALALAAGGLLLIAGTPLSAQRGPAPEISHINAETLAQACAPTPAYEQPLAALRITGGQDTFVHRSSYAPGDLITLNAGTDNGIDIGQEFYARRLQADYRQTITPRTPGVVRTTGWIRVYAVDRKWSLATVTHVCETVDVGDYLEPLVFPSVPATEAEVLPFERDNYGHILIGADRRQSFAKGDFIVVDLGSSQGVTPGARFVVFRDKLEPGNYLYNLGEAVAVDVRENTATLKVTISRDALLVGDYVGLRKPTGDTR